ncbi:hypothetical protein QT971_19890 [Microcoleus sp. herbarium19]|uniref:hypothetical protein n=1 Tax=unclassified Microcoleus TaxID=2642155 RepID=UPI002FD12F1D
MLGCSLPTPEPDNLAFGSYEQFLARRGSQGWPPPVALSCSLWCCDTRSLRAIETYHTSIEQQG